MSQLTFCSSWLQPACSLPYKPGASDCDPLMTITPSHEDMLMVHDLQLTEDPIKPMVIGSHVLPRQCSAERTLDIVEEDMLEEDDGVVAADGALQQRFGIGHCGACHQLHSRDGLEVRLQALAVLCAQLAPHATWPSNHDWHLQSQVAYYGHAPCYGKGPSVSSMTPCCL